MLGETIKQTRQAAGLSQKALGEPEFSATFVDAVERGTIHPSALTVKLLAERLNLAPDSDLDPDQGLLTGPPTTTTAAEQHSDWAMQGPPDVAAYQQDLHYQLDHATTLIQSSRVEEALRLIESAEAGIAPIMQQLSLRARYRISYVRGMGYLVIGKPGTAEHELERSLALVVQSREARPGPLRKLVSRRPATGARRRDRDHVSASTVQRLRQKSEEQPDEIEARVRNLMGVAYYLQHKITQAEEQHLACLHASQDKQIRDPNLRFSIYRNLANDYWAADKFDRSISIYKEALRLFEDMSDQSKLAALHWGLSMAYKAAENRPFAKIHMQKAHYIYREKQAAVPEAMTAMNLAELLIDDHQYTEAEELLDRAAAKLETPEALIKEGAVVGLNEESTDPQLMSNLYQDYARLAHGRGQLEKGAEYASRSIAYGNSAYEAVTEDPSLASGYPLRQFAEALHTGALIQEELGKKEEADRLFERAIGISAQAGFEESRVAIMYSYAAALRARRDYEGASRYLSLATSVRIDANRKSRVP